MPILCSICNRKSKLPEDHSLWPSLDNAKIDMYPITAKGKPELETLGWICASCLRYGNSMRTHIKAQMTGVEISKHAVDRYLERYKGPPMSEQRARLSLLKLFALARRIRIKDEYVTADRLKYGDAEFRHYLSGGLRFIVSTEDPPRIVTVVPVQRFREGIDFLYI